MKKTTLLTALVLCISFLASCTPTSGDPDIRETNTTAESTKTLVSSEMTTENNTVDSTETEAPPPAGDGLQRIRIKVEKVFTDFKYGGPEEIENMYITVDIPEHFVPAEEIDNCTDYMRYDPQYVTYRRAFELGAVYRVNSDFVMDETIHSNTDTGGTWRPLSDYQVSMSTTANGYEYVLYEKDFIYENNEFEDNYDATVYVRVSDVYVAKLTYSDWIENSGLLAGSIDSVSVELA